MKKLKKYPSEIQYNDFARSSNLSRSYPAKNPLPWEAVITYSSSAKSCLSNFTKLIAYIFFVLIYSQQLTAQIGNALVLDGCTNFFEVQENDLLDYDQAISLECWIQPNCEDGNNVILSKQWCQGQYGYYLSVNRGRLFWSYSIQGECSSTSTFQTIDVTVLPNEFTHVAIVHTETEINLFINGIEALIQRNQGAFGSVRNSSEPFRIGAYKNVAGSMTNHFSGLVDELRLWNLALDEASIQARKDIRLTGNETGLVLYLDMEETGQGSSLLLENSSSFGAMFDATAAGFTATTPYISNEQEYNQNIINFGADMFVCDPTVSLSIPNRNYKNVIWNDGSSGSDLIVSSSGTYFVEAQTELCKFYRDTINIDLSDRTIITNQHTLCANDTVFINGIPYTESGVYFDTIPALTMQCDTILENTIDVIPEIFTNLRIESCPNSIITYEGEELLPESITSFVFASASGCDSVVTVEITPSLVLEETVEFAACEGEQIDYNGSILTPNTSNEFIFSSVEGCDSIVTVTVLSNPTNNSFLGRDTVICTSRHTLLSPNENTLWNDEFTSNRFSITASGTYEASFIDSLGCINTDTIRVSFAAENNVYVPNAFSPNGNQENDCFKPMFSSNVNTEFYRLSIYNRWGARVFETTDTEECWDGKLDGKPLNSSVFVWMIEGINGTCETSELLVGDVALFR